MDNYDFDLFCRFDKSILANISQQSLCCVCFVCVCVCFCVCIFVCWVGGGVCVYVLFEADYHQDVMRAAFSSVQNIFNKKYIL